MDNANLSLRLQLNDAYYFRNFLNMMKMESGPLVMLFSPTSITFNQKNAKGCGIHELTFNLDEVAEYVYNFRDEEDKLLPLVKLVANPDEFFTRVKLIAKKDSILIYMYQDSSHFMIKPYKATVEESSHDKALILPLLDMPEVLASKTGEDWSKVTPLKITNKKFTDICSESIGAKISDMTFSFDQANPNLIVIQGLSSNNNPVTHNQFSLRPGIGYSAASTPLPEHEGKQEAILDSLKNLNLNAHLGTEAAREIEPVRIPLKTVKTLAKIHTIGLNNSIQIKIYIKPGWLRITSLVGTSATYSSEYFNI